MCAFAAAPGHVQDGAARLKERVQNETFGLQPASMLEADVHIHAGMHARRF